MLEKRFEHRKRALHEDVERVATLFLPTIENMETLYRHWLRANQEMLEGFREVLESRIAVLDKKPASKKQKIPVQEERSGQSTSKH